MKKNISLSPEQKLNIRQLLKQAKFDRLVKGLLADKKLSTDEKAKLVYQLKKKLFDSTSTPRTSRF